MAATSGFQLKLHAIISEALREEWAFSKTSHINQAADLAAEMAVLQVEKLNRESQKGVRSIDFLDLPAEIRNTIYEYTVTDQHDVAVDYHAVKSYKIRKSWEWEFRPFGPPGGQPAITRASRQLRQETLKLFYALNSFSTEVDSDEDERGGDQAVDVAAVNAWLEAIGDENAQCIQQFTVKYYKSDLDAARISKDEIMSGKGLRKVAGAAKWVCH